MSFTVKNKHVAICRKLDENDCSSVRYRYTWGSNTISDRRICLFFQGRSICLFCLSGECFSTMLVYIHSCSIFICSEIRCYFCFTYFRFHSFVRSSLKIMKEKIVRKQERDWNVEIIENTFYNLTSCSLC